MHPEYFFTYETKLPSGLGYRLFGPEHCCWMLLLLLSGWLCLRHYLKLQSEERRRQDRFLGLSCVEWILLRTFVLVLTGDFGVYELPLHLCSLAGIFCAVHAFTRSKILGELLYTACLPGAVCAVIFPNAVFYPAIHFITIESYLFHGAVVLYIICQLCSGQITPSLQRWPAALGLLAAIAVPVRLFDTHFSANYMFLAVPSAGSPLVLLATIAGKQLYPVALFLLAAFAMLLMELAAAFLLHIKKQLR